jgi:hypothetical protein
MATVEELSAPYENHLLPVLAAGPGVCRVCHTSNLEPYDTCYRCNENDGVLGQGADAVSFVALAVKHEQLARDLWVYKSDKPETIRRSVSAGLAAITWRWLSKHEQCLANAVGIDEFEAVMTVPSAKGRVDHPLESMVRDVIGQTKPRFQQLLRANPDLQSEHYAQHGQFVMSGDLVRGTPALLIDDTWTSGGHAQSAAQTLREAGAGPVGIVAIGRHFQRQPERPEYRESAEAYYRRAKAQGWSWDSCCLCAPEE